MRIVPPLVAVLFFVACVSDTASIPTTSASDAAASSDAGTSSDVNPITDDAGNTMADAAEEPPPPPKPGTPIGAVSVDVNGSSNAGFEGPDGAAVAKDGSLILVGLHADDLTIHEAGGATTTALSPKSPRPEGFVLALDPSGKKKWAVGISSANTATFRNVALGPNGDVFAMADFSGANAVIHGAGADVPVTAGSASGSVCLVKLAGNDGRVLWVQNFGTTPGGGSFIGRGLSVVDDRILVLIDAFRPLMWNGAATVTGSFLGVMNDGAGAPAPVAYTMFGPQPADRALAASLAPDKSVVIGGEFFSATFKVLGTQLAQSGALSDGWVASLKPDLTSPNWVKRLDYSWANNTNFGEVRSIATTPSDIFVGGSVTGQLVVDGTLINAAAQDGVVLNFDPTNGNLKGSPLLGGSANESIASVQMARDGRLVAGQYTSNDSSVDAFKFPNPTIRGAFFFKRAGGAIPFAFSVAGPNVEATGTVLTQTGDFLYALGSFKGTTNVGPTQLVSQNAGAKFSIFVAHLAP